MTLSSSATFRLRLAHYLRTKRGLLHFTQEQLSVKAGFHPTFVGRIERSEQNISIENLDKLAKALHVGSPSTASPSMMEQFSKNLRNERRARSMSQIQLAEMCGFHRTYLSQLERGVAAIAIDNVEKFARALQVTEQSLLGY